MTRTTKVHFWTNNLLGSTHPEVAIMNIFQKESLDFSIFSSGKISYVYLKVMLTQYGFMSIVVNIHITLKTLAQSF